MNQSSRYIIRIGAHLEGDLADWFAPLTVVNEPGGGATLAGEMRDQAALHGVLAKIRDLNLPLIALERLDQPNHRDETGHEPLTRLL